MKGAETRYSGIAFQWFGPATRSLYVQLTTLSAVLLENIETSFMSARYTHPGCLVFHQSTADESY